MRMQVSEEEFNKRMKSVMDSFDTSHYQFVSGPGRSGAIASVYFSHYCGLSFLPYKGNIPENMKHKVLVVDTAQKSGRTVRKAAKLYNNEYITFFEGDELHHIFWYEKDFK